MISNTQLGTDSIEVTNTDTDTELFLQRRLHRSAGHLWIGAAGRNQPLEHGFSQFGWMPLPCVLESGFSPCLYRLHQTVRSRSTDVKA